MDVTITRDSDGLPVPMLNIDINGREALLQEHTTLMHDLSSAHRWFDDPDVPAAEKEARWLVLFNMRDRQRFLSQLLTACGIPLSVVMENLDLPF